MLGAVIGDIVGSVYEWHNIKTKDFPLFRDDCFFTDDSVMTFAVALAIMAGGSDDDYIDAMKKLGRQYPNSGYGGRFGTWLVSNDRKPYNSWGNGSAMRVAPCGWLRKGGKTAAQKSAAVTHNHPEGIKGAVAVADAICICRDFSEGTAFASIDDCKNKIREHITSEYGYDLSRTLDQIRPTYEFNESCMDTVPQAIVAFLESTGFEDAIRNAISLGGDSDTLAAITGSIAEAAYGIPEEIRKKALTYLDPTLLSIYDKWEQFLKNC